MRIPSVNQSNVNQKSNQQAFKAFYIENTLNKSYKRLTGDTTTTLGRIPFFKEIKKAGDNILYIINADATRLRLSTIFDAPINPNFPKNEMEVMGEVKDLAVFVTGEDIKEIEKLSPHGQVSYLQYMVLNDSVDLRKAAVDKRKNVEIKIDIIQN